MLRLRTLFAALVLCLVLSPASSRAQEPPTPPEEGETVRLFLDCNTMGCYDQDYLRTEIQFVNWVRDPADADVYLNITALGTGAGGRAAELVFTGQERFEDMADTLTWISGFDATTDEEREGLTRMIKVGLMRFVGQTPLVEDIEIGLRLRKPAEPGAEGPLTVMSPEDDPWDFWVFRVRGSGGLSGRTNTRSSRFSGSLSANRVTEDWKVSLSLSSSYNDTRYDYPELDYYRLSIRRSHSFSGMLVKSIADQWSAGLRGSARNATYYNFDFAGSLAPVVEYSVFPYEEATRRSLTFQYALEAVYHDYREETVFFKNEESFVTQSLSASLSFNRRWGNAFAALEGAHHLNDLDLHHVSLFGGLSLRLGRGLSLSVHGNVSRVKDLISVAADADATVEEILLSRRQLETDYTYSTSISLSYTFGSIFNNVVNPRLGGGGVGIPIIMF